MNIYKQYTINLGLVSSSCLHSQTLRRSPCGRLIHLLPRQGQQPWLQLGRQRPVGPRPPGASPSCAARALSSSLRALSAPSTRKSLSCKPAPPFPPLPLEEPSSSEDPYIESNNLVTVFDDAPSASSKVGFERNHSIQESLNLSYASSVSKIDFTCLSIKRRCSM